MGTGLIYGTMAAGVVDHSDHTNQSINMCTFRFWRDLGYAFGAVLSGLAADASSPEISMLCFAVFSLFIAGVVGGHYEEAGFVKIDS